MPSTNSSSTFGPPTVSVLSGIELFIIATPQPFILPDDAAKVLSTWGYDLLAQQHATLSLPVPPSHKQCLVLAAQDLQPRMKDGANQRIFKAARSLGRTLRKSDAHVLTPVHHAEALSHVFGPQADVLLKQAAQNQAAFQPPYPVIRTLSNHAARSRVDVVTYKGGTAVSKTFRPTARDYLQREIQGRALDLPEIAPILEAGDTYFVMPFYETSWRWEDNGLRLYPLDRARRCFAFLRAVHAKGHALVDAHPGSFLFDDENKLRIADLEHVMPQPEVRTFEESFDIAGPPSGYKGHLPAGRAVTYNSAWKPVLGVSLQELHSPSAHSLRRALYWLFRRLPKWLLKKIAVALKPARHVRTRDGYLLHWPG